MAHKIVLLPRATRDIRRTVTWLTEHNSSKTAERWNARIRSALQSLSNNPEQWPLAEEAQRYGVDFREMFSGRRPHVYRILYSIDSNLVYIHHIRHAAQDYLTEDEI